ncbi:MAG: general secretion pathway protein GspK [Phycisphaerales bacterium]|nr:general secretion pathway protein GspK [Phycisphaerales bacterium]
MRRSRAQGSTLLVVLWTVSLLSLVVVSVQVSSLRQAASSREVLAQVRARWAARAGVERIIARLGWENENPTPTGPITLIADLASLAEGELGGATYQAAYSEGASLVAGPVDSHAKLNVNAMTRDGLLLLPDMTEDVADAILDWIDADDDVREQGAEAGYYLTAAFPYEPRNGPVRSLVELELIRNVLPEFVRGEDWNQNGRLDLNEDDGSTTWPPDNADGELDAGWSAILTAHSVEGGLTDGGEERINLRTTTPEEIATRLRIEEDQATAISNYASNQGNIMEGLLRDSLDRVAPNGSVSPQVVSQVRPLTQGELRTLFAEATFDDSTQRVPGKLNINTAPAEVFEYLPNLSPALADQIVYGRDRRREGFESIVDLRDIPGITGSVLAELATFLSVRGNVYRVCSRGRDEATGIEVEIIAVLDRSTLPVKIVEYSVR